MATVKKYSGLVVRVGGRERRSTAAVQTLARLPGDSPISRSVWTAVALAPLWGLKGLRFVKKNPAAGQKVVDKNRKRVFYGATSLKKTLLAPGQSVPNEHPQSE